MKDRGNGWHNGRDGRTENSWQYDSVVHREGSSSKVRCIDNRRTAADQRMREQVVIVDVEQRRGWSVSE